MKKKMFSLKTSENSELCEKEKNNPYIILPMGDTIVNIWVHFLSVCLSIYLIYEKSKWDDITSTFTLIVSLSNIYC